MRVLYHSLVKCLSFFDEEKHRGLSPEDIPRIGSGFLVTIPDMSSTLKGRIVLTTAKILLDDCGKLYKKIYFGLIPNQKILAHPIFYPGHIKNEYIHNICVLILERPIEYVTPLEFDTEVEKSSLIGRIVTSVGFGEVKRVISGTCVSDTQRRASKSIVFISTSERDGIVREVWPERRRIDDMYMPNGYVSIIKSHDAVFHCSPFLESITSSDDLTRYANTNLGSVSQGDLGGPCILDGKVVGVISVIHTDQSFILEGDRYITSSFCGLYKEFMQNTSQGITGFKPRIKEIPFINGSLFEDGINTFNELLSNFSYRGSVRIFV